MEEVGQSICGTAEKIAKRIADAEAAKRIAWQAAYEQVLAEHEQHKTLFATILTDVNLKTFRFECQKVVNTLVNAISPASSSHLVDKLDRLHNLLLGRSIVINERSFSASQHPGGIEYCLELLSKKLVAQVSTFPFFYYGARSVSRRAGGYWRRVVFYGKFRKN